MKKILSILIIALIIAGIGFGVWYFNLFGYRLTAEAARGRKLVSELYDEAKYVGPVIKDEPTSPLQYSAGDWIIQTDHTGNAILSVALSAKAADEVQKNQGPELSDDELKEIAEKEWQRYIDIKYQVKAEITKEGGMVNISLCEIKEKNETGARAFLSYFGDGTLFCVSFSDRYAEFLADEPRISLKEAYEKAFGYVTEERGDLELIYDFKEEAVKEGMTGIGPMYLVEIYGRTDAHPDWDVYCCAQINAVTGKLHHISYDDR